jgi:hypothetical protein
MTTIKNLTDLAGMLCADGDGKEELERSIERNVYKHTECGAWIDFTDTGIRIGSIVEGSDVGTSSFALDYPFEEETYRQCEAAIEKEADAIWEWANTPRWWCPSCNAANDSDSIDELVFDDSGELVIDCPTCNTRIVMKTDADLGIDFPDVWVEHQGLPGFSSPE